MRTVADRIEVGTCDLGTVYVYSFAGVPDNGQPTEFRYQVRAGNHTISTKPTLAEAMNVANALAGRDQLDQVEQPIDDVPEVIAEVVTRTRKRVSRIDE